MVQTDLVQMEMLKILQQTQQKMLASTSYALNPPGNQGHPAEQTPSGNQGRPGGRPQRKTPDNASYPHSKTDEYCWTHGGSNHALSECNRRAPGHKGDSMFESCIGGSNAYIPKIK